MSFAASLGPRPNYTNPSGNLNITSRSFNTSNANTQGVYSNYPQNNGMVSGTQMNNFQQNNQQQPANFHMNTQGNAPTVQQPQNIYQTGNFMNPAQSSQNNSNNQTNNTGGYVNPFNLKNKAPTNIFTNPNNTTSTNPANNISNNIPNQFANQFSSGNINYQQGIPFNNAVQNPQQAGIINNSQQGLQFNNGVAKNPLQGMQIFANNNTQQQVMQLTNGMMSNQQGIQLQNGIINNPQPVIQLPNGIILNSQQGIQFANGIIQNPQFNNSFQNQQGIALNNAQNLQFSQYNPNLLNNQLNNQFGNTNQNVQQNNSFSNPFAAPANAIQNSYNYQPSNVKADSPIFRNISKPTAISEAKTSHIEPNKNNNLIKTGVRPKSKPSKYIIYCKNQKLLSLKAACIAMRDQFLHQKLSKEEIRINKIRGVPTNSISQILARHNQTALPPNPFSKNPNPANPNSKISGPYLLPEAEKSKNTNANQANNYFSNSGLNNRNAANYTQGIAQNQNQQNTTPVSNPFAKKTNSISNNANQFVSQANLQNQSGTNLNSFNSLQNQISPFSLQQQLNSQGFNSALMNNNVSSNNPLLNNNQYVNNNPLLNNNQALNTNPLSNNNPLTTNNPLLANQYSNNSQLPIYNNQLTQSQILNNINNQQAIFNNSSSFFNQLSPEYQQLIRNQLMLQNQTNNQQMQLSNQWPFSNQQQLNQQISQSTNPLPNLLNNHGIYQNTLQNQFLYGGNNQYNSALQQQLLNGTINPNSLQNQFLNNGYLSNGMPFNQFTSLNNYNLINYDQNGQLLPLAMGGVSISNILRSRWSDPLNISPLDKDEDVLKKMLFFISQGGKFQNEVSNTREFCYSNDKKINDLLKGLEFFYIQLANNQTKNDRIRECLKKLNLPELYLHSHPTLGEEWRRDLLIKNLQLSLPISPEDIRKSQYFQDSIFTPLPRYIFDPIKHVKAVEEELKQIVKEDINPLAEEAYKSYLESPTGKYYGPDLDIKEMIKKDQVLAKQIIENNKKLKEYDDYENSQPEYIMKGTKKGYIFNEPERSTFDEDDMERKYIEMIREKTFLEYDFLRQEEQEEKKSEEYINKMKRKREEAIRESNRKKLFIEEDDGRFVIVPVFFKSKELGKDE